MSTGLYTHRTRFAGEIVTDVLYNTAHKNQQINDVPNEAGAHSDNLAQFQATQAPAPGGVVNQVAAFADELEQLRFTLADIKTALNGGVPLAEWYTPLSIPAGVQVGRGARVFKNTTQSISFKTQTAIVFNTVRYDTGVTDPAVNPFFSLSNPTRLTGQTSGIFQIGGTVRFDVGHSGVVAAFIRLNGTKLLCASEWQSDGVQDPWLDLSTQYELNPTDYVELIVFQECNNPFNVVNPEFGLELLNPNAVVTPPTMFTLMITETGTGSGVVTSDVGGINCPGVCSASYTSGDVVMLTATPSVGGFVTWSGDVPVGHETDNPLTVTMDQARTINAVFTAFTLTISEAGTGAGIVTSDIGGINCPGMCSAQYAPGDVVTLTATSTVGTFDSWSGDLSTTTNPTTITMNADKNVVATFKMVGVRASWNNSVGSFTGTKFITPSDNMAIVGSAGAAAFEMPLSSGCRFTKMRVLLPAVLAVGHSLTFQMVVNGSATGATLSMIAGDQDKAVTLAVDTISGDKVCVEVVQVGGGGDTLNALTLVYVPV